MALAVARGLDDPDTTHDTLWRDVKGAFVVVRGASHGAGEEYGRMLSDEPSALAAMFRLYAAKLDER